MPVRASQFESVRKRISAGVSRLQSRPAELRIVVAAGGLAAFSLWLGLAWGEPLGLVALPLLAVLSVGSVAVLRRRDRDAELDALVPSIDGALLLARTRPRNAAAIAPTQEPRPELPAPPVVSVPDPLTEAPAPGERSYEVHETAAGGTVLHQVCPTLLSASDYALGLVQRRPGSTVEVIRVSRGERKIVLSFADDRVASEPELKQTLLEMYGYPVTRWRAMPPSGRPSGQGTSWRASR